MSKNLTFLKSLTGALLTVIVISLASCYPNDDLSVSQTDLVMTTYYDSVDFTTIKTYYMSDTVHVVREDTSDHSLMKDNDLVISLIEQNLAAYGYTRVTDTAAPIPDVKVTAAAITIKTVTIGWWYPYYPGWGWGWGYWKKGPSSTNYYYPGYPGYYPPGYWWGYPYYSSYTTGTVLMEMANPLDYIVVDGDTVTPIYWTGAVNGVLGTTSSNTARLEAGINKAFELSPEIKTN